MITRRVALKYATNLVVTRSTTLPASHAVIPAWQATWDDLHIEVARQAQIPGQPPVTREESWYLLRIHPSIWRQWLELFRAEGCREIAAFAATVPPARLLQALHALEDEMSPEPGA
ncbi:MAG: hypothetical protein U0Z70_07050 [Thermomicrobiales bacterium]